jgi:hypothetical protein
VKLVMQVGKNDADGGWNFGVEKATRAARGMDYLGYDGSCFFTNDKTTLVSVDTWRSHLDGAASILDIHRVGAYGFRNAMDAAIGHAVEFWQAGRKSDVAQHVGIWQDNNQQVFVGKILCDRNLMKVRTGNVDVSQVPEAVWNQEITRYPRPGDTDTRSKAAAYQILSYGNQAAWTAVDLLKEVVTELADLKGKVDQLLARPASGPGNYDAVGQIQFVKHQD